MGDSNTGMGGTGKDEILGGGPTDTTDSTSDSGGTSQKKSDPFDQSDDPYEQTPDKATTVRCTHEEKVLLEQIRAERAKNEEPFSKTRLFREKIREEARKYGLLEDEDESPQ